METVDILLPPKFEKSGETKELKQALQDRDWVGAFNLWIIKEKPVPAIVYQVRSDNSKWAPGKLDATAGGKYVAGEEAEDGLREAKEEMGKIYNPKDLFFVGRKLSVLKTIKDEIANTVVDIAFIKDESDLDSYTLEENEVFAICECPIEELIKVHSESDYEFEVEALDFNKKIFTKKITKNSFPYNWDDYHFKIALLVDRFLKGDKNLIY